MNNSVMKKRKQAPLDARFGESGTLSNALRKEPGTILRSPKGDRGHWGKPPQKGSFNVTKKGKRSPQRKNIKNV